MTAPVLRSEEADRRHVDVFSQRDEELRRANRNMPVPLGPEYPFLMTKADGVVYPYTEAMAERSDLVVGCYNLDGSTDPSDYVPGYDPSAVQSDAEKRAARIENVRGINGAERKAWEAAERKRIRAELEAEMKSNAPAVVVAPAPATTPAPDAKAGKAGKAGSAGKEPGTTRRNSRSKKDTPVDAAPAVAAAPVVASPVEQPAPAAEAPAADATTNEALADEVTKILNSDF